MTRLASEVFFKECTDEKVHGSLVALRSLWPYNATGKTWVQGDFNGDAKVDINDLIIVLANYGHTVGASGAGIAPVPEPGALALLAAALVGLLAYGWRKCRFGIFSGAAPIVARRRTPGKEMRVGVPTGHALR